MYATVVAVLETDQMTICQSYECSHVKKIHFGCYLEFAASQSNFLKLSGSYTMQAIIIVRLITFVNYIA